MSTLDEITKEKQRISEALARIDMQRDDLASQLGELEATERVLARYQQGHAGKKDGLSQTADYGKEGGRSLGDQILALATGKTQQEIATACGQGRSPQPCRCRACPAQAGGPHRRARWETLRHTVNQDGPTGRALTTGGSSCCGAEERRFA